MVFSACTPGYIVNGARTKPRGDVEWTFQKRFIYQL